jgi:hypothetical protein
MNAFENVTSRTPARLALAFGTLLLALTTTGCTMQQLQAGEQAATPTFSPSGGTFTTPQTITLSDIVPNAPIYYATTPTMQGATVKLYTGPFTVSTSETIYAVAAEDGYYSDIANATYTIQTPAATPAPTISPNGGSFPTNQTVTLADAISGASIYYTHLRQLHAHPQSRLPAHLYL